jgi:hypothetical protein
MKVLVDERRRNVDERRVGVGNYASWIVED